MAASFVAPGPCGVAVRDRFKHLTPQDEKVLRAVGERQGALGTWVYYRVEPSVLAAVGQMLRTTAA